LAILAVPQSTERSLSRKGTATAGEKQKAKNEYGETSKTAKGTDCFATERLARCSFSHVF